MDHTELLFAMQVRQLALGRLSKNAPDHLTDEGRRAFIIENFPATLVDVIHEIEDVAEMVAKARRT
jgi:hypothetical protein